MSEDPQNQGEQSRLSMPTELEGKALVDKQDNGEAGEIQDAPTQSTDDRSVYADGLIGFADNTHQYIRDHISIADRKAAFVLTLAAGLLIYLHETNATSLWLKNPNSWSLIDTIGFFAMWGLAASCVFAIAVVYPRLDGSRRGHVFWNGIKEFTSASEYVDSVTRLTEANVLEEVIRHAYELASICKTKYRVLNWALRAGTFGGVATIVLLLFRQISGQ